MLLIPMQKSQSSSVTQTPSDLFRSQDSSIPNAESHEDGLTFLKGFLVDFLWTMCLTQAKTNKNKAKCVPFSGWQSRLAEHQPLGQASPPYPHLYEHQGGLDHTAMQARTPWVLQEEPMERAGVVLHLHMEPIQPHFSHTEVISMAMYLSVHAL